MVAEEGCDSTSRERQYKTRFKKWQLEKNVDSKRIKAIVQIEKIAA